MKIYVASSWRNERQPSVVEALRAAGHEVYDFRNPEPGDTGFHWSEIDPAWKQWSPERFRDSLEHPIAKDGFTKDMDALVECDACVLVMPCGRSAHLELGWAVGAGKATAILLEDGEPELMYRMVDFLAIDLGEVIDWAVEAAERLDDLDDESDFEPPLLEPRPLLDSRSCPHSRNVTTGDGSEVCLDCGAVSYPGDD